MPRSVQNVVFIALVGLGWGLLGPGSKVVVRGRARDVRRDHLGRRARRVGAPRVSLSRWRRVAVAPPRLDAKRWAGVVAAGRRLRARDLGRVHGRRAVHVGRAHLVSDRPLAGDNTALAALVFRTRARPPRSRSRWCSASSASRFSRSRAAPAARRSRRPVMVVWLLSFAVYACLLRVRRHAHERVMTMCAGRHDLDGVVLVPGLRWAKAARSRTRPTRRRSPAGSSARSSLGSTLVAQTAFAAAVRRLGVSAATIGAEYTALAVGVACRWCCTSRGPALTVVGGLVLCARWRPRSFPSAWLGTREARARGRVALPACRAFCTRRSSSTTWPSRSTSTPTRWGSSCWAGRTTIRATRTWRSSGRAGTRTSSWSTIWKSIRRTRSATATSISRSRSKAICRQSIERMRAQGVKIVKEPKKSPERHALDRVRRGPERHSRRAARAARRPPIA